MSNATVAQRRLVAVALSVVAVALASCADKRIRDLDVGISKDSMLKVVGRGAPEGDSLPNIYRHNAYLVQGKMFEVYFFDPENRKLADSVGVPSKELTPIVVLDGRVEGWGWRYASKLTEEYGIPVREDVERDAQRLAARKGG
jgi:hypothetical protein